jgi:microcystin degradation protein MlrC
MTAVIWNDEKGVHMLTDMHRPPAEGNFCVEHGKAKSMSFLQISLGTCATLTEGTMDIYAVSWRTWKWTKSIFALLGLNYTE